MRIDALSLHNFRNFVQLELPLQGRIIGFVGDNGHGKTNILEASYLVSTGNSWRTSRSVDMMHELSLHSSVRAHLSGEDTADLSLSIVRELPEAHVARTRYFVNGIPRTKQVYALMSPVVVFAPEDLASVTGSPSLRRQMVDRLLAVCDRLYSYHLRQYTQVLVRRNKLLLAIREREAEESALSFWTEKMIVHGTYLLQQREQYFASLENEMPYAVKYQPNVQIESYAAKVEANLFKEILSGTSQYGPHKDDFLFLVDDKDAARFGSRGQQRSVMVWFLMQQYIYIRSTTQKVPIVLLDDVFSELDTSHRHQLLAFFADAQLLITGCEKEYFKTGFDEVFEVKAGTIV